MIGSKNPNWKGGVLLQGGYRYILDKSHPNGHRGYVYEHRIVVERKIGRYLDKSEIVHHKNGNKLDNRIDNLEIISRSDHASMHMKNREVESSTKNKISLRLKDWYKTKEGIKKRKSLVIKAKNQWKKRKIKKLI